MSLLPQQILPQNAVLGKVDADGNVVIDKNWWLFLYNLATNSLNPPTGGVHMTIADQLMLNELDVGGMPTSVAGASMSGTNITGGTVNGATITGGSLSGAATSGNTDNGSSTIPAAPGTKLGAISGTLLGLHIISARGNLLGAAAGARINLT